MYARAGKSPEVNVIKKKKKIAGVQIWLAFQLSGPSVDQD
jgi:hypothetical protein